MTKVSLKLDLGTTAQCGKATENTAWNGEVYVIQLCLNKAVIFFKEGQEDPLEEGMATHSSTLFLPGESAWTEKPGWPQSIWSQRVRHD